MGRRLKRKQKKLTMRDVPKDVLVKLVTAMKVEFSEKEIAEVVICDRLKRAAGHAKGYEKAVAAGRTIRAVRRRRPYEIEAQRHSVNCSTLLASSRELAKAFGLTEKYFKRQEEKEAAGGGTPA